MLKYVARAEAAMMDGDKKKRMVDLAISRLPAAEAHDMLRLVETAIKRMKDYPPATTFVAAADTRDSAIARKPPDILDTPNWQTICRNANPVERTGLVKELVRLRERLIQRVLVLREAHGPAVALEDQAAQPAQETALTVERGISKVYEIAVKRFPAEAEIGIWKTNFQNGLAFHEFLLLMMNSPEAQATDKSTKICEDKDDGEFIQLAYELMHGRGCSARELEYWRSNIQSGVIKRSEILAQFFSEAVRYHEGGTACAVHDGLSCQIMGTSRLVSVDDWHKKAQEFRDTPPGKPDTRYRHSFHIKTEPRVLITAIASLYRGGDFIEQFMDNITSQSCFDDYCELVIVDADSPENEGEVIQRYLARHRGINYIKMNHRIGIYEAWNVGVKHARGDYLTNTNLDDLRRRDSFEMQAGVLENLSFVDVVYQEFYYSFDPRLSCDEIAAFGYESNLPVITPYNMMDFNSPHNAPMWRKRLHEELGFFNTSFKSAGDWEFWMRCLAAGKTFYKLNDPHVCYYQNPKGLSTRPDTRGVLEAREISRIYGRKLISENVVMPFERFCAEKLRGAPLMTDGGKHDRYSQSQQAIRSVARRLKFAAARPGEI